jgi:hypothetical protein
MNAVRRPKQASSPKQQQWRRPVPPVPAGDDEWTNTSDNCQDDEIQVIFNNSKGKEKEVNFLIANRGECPVRVAVTRRRDTGAIPNRDQRHPRQLQGARQHHGSGRPLHSGCVHRHQRPPLRLEDLRPEVLTAGGAARATCRAQ